jgi:hypothetical protein
LETIDLDSWAAFEAALQQLTAAHEVLRAKQFQQRLSPLLFRGQRNASWELTSTLERYNPPSLQFTQYYRAILSAKPQIEAHTDSRWDVQPYVDFAKLARNSDAGLSLKADPPAYDYMVYLRHHGFPSPLLDWSRSPYVAAYFAFSEATDADGRVAIFAYREFSSMVKSGSPTAPAIVVHGPYVRTHRRHFIQQCQYTMCYAYDDPEWHYTPHESVFAQAVENQDTLWKFTLPQSERQRVLAQLDKYNLNAYSLFGSEEALMQVMAARELTHLR